MPSICPFGKTLTALFSVAFLCFGKASVADTEASALKKNETKEVIDAVGKLLDEYYIFPEISQQIIEFMAEKSKNGEYRDIDDAHGLAQQLTKDLQSISHDRHLRVFFDPERVERLRQQENEQVTPEQVAKRLRNAQSKNFGFKEVSILDGNVGYIDLRKFEDPAIAGDTVTAAMAFLENTDALIFDLRNNGGGYPHMVQLIVSYLLDGDPIHLNDVYNRQMDRTKQFWSLGSVPGKRRPDVEVYVLNSSGTFSAAEDFGYTLKHLERATIIGEATGGGAHPGGRQVATDRFVVWLPTARSINPITKTNWEGVGVIPHIEVPAKDALAKAHIMALENIVAKSTEGTELKQWYLTTLKAKSETVTVDEALLKSYVGTYGPRTLTFENGYLYYQRKGRNKFQLFPINDHLFLVEDNDDFRIKIVMEGNKVVALQGVSDNGSYSQNKKDS